METFVFFLIWVVIVVVSVVNQNKKRKALEAQRRQQAEGSPAAAEEAAAPDLREVLGDLLEEAAPAAGQQREEPEPVRAPQPTRPTPRSATWKPREEAHRELAPRPDTRRGPLIKEDFSGDEHAGSTAPKTRQWKAPLIADTAPALASVAPPTEGFHSATSAYAARFAHAGRDQLRDGVIWAEVMGKPLALRDA